MIQKVKKINKAFILAGGAGSRMRLDNRYNLKAFIEIDDEQLLKRHIRLIKNYLNPEKRGSSSYFGALSYNNGDHLKPLYIQTPKMKCLTNYSEIKAIMQSILKTNFKINSQTKTSKNQECVGWIMENDKTINIKSINEIPLGHKIALQDLKEGDTILKYGHDIGKVVKSIKKGEHVHVHNVKTKKW